MQIMNGIKIYKSIFSSALGFLEICADTGEAVSRIYFTSSPSTDYTETAVTRQAVEELEEYFAGKRLYHYLWRKQQYR